MRYVVRAMATNYQPRNTRGAGMIPYKPTKVTKGYNTIRVYFGRAWLTFRFSGHVLYCGNTASEVAVNSDDRIKAARESARAQLI